MINFDDLDQDPLAEVLAAPIAPRAIPANAPADLIFENCRKCGGSGVFTSWNGRSVGQCFACKGKGRLGFKTPAPVRASRREDAARRAATAAEGAWDAFALDFAPEAAWLAAEAGRFPFAASLRDAVRKFGRLTDAQLAAVRRCMVKGAERATARAEVQKTASRPLDISKLDEAFAVARASGAVKAAIRTGTVVFSLAPAGGRNPGSIYVKDRSSGEYLGKIAGGRFSASFACTETNAADVAEAAADPKAAALRYAAETDECSVCGRLLTDPDSKAAGIGPVCAAKFGW